MIMNLLSISIHCCESGVHIHINNLNNSFQLYQIYKELLLKDLDIETRDLSTKMRSAL